MKINFFEKLLATCFYFGYFPFMPGTAGSFFALLVYLIPGAETPFFMILVISFLTVAGIKLGTKFEEIYGKDPKIFVLDEFVGMWISLLFVPKKIWYIAGVFILWRVLDIIKPYPAKQIEKIKGGAGIMFDDIIAGFYTFIIVQLFFMLSRLFFNFNTGL